MSNPKIHTINVPDRYNHAWIREHVELGSANDPKREDILSSLGFPALLIKSEGLQPDTQLQNLLKQVGTAIDAYLNLEFAYQDLVIRGVSYLRHNEGLAEEGIPQYDSIDDFHAAIAIAGWDRMNPEIQPKRYGKMEGGCDIYAVEFPAYDRQSFTEMLLSYLHVNLTLNRRVPFPIDILLLYRMQSMEQVLYQQNGVTNYDAWKFANFNNKADSLLAVLKLK